MSKLPNKGLLFGYALFVLAFAGVCVRLAHGQQPTTVTTQPAKGAAIKSLPATITTIKWSIDKQWPDLTTSSAEDDANTIGFPLSGFATPIIIPTSNQTRVSFAGTSAELGKAFLSVQQQLTADSFKIMPSNTNEDSLTEVIYFERADAVCQVTSYRLLDVACAPLASIKALATQSQPLLAALSKSDPTDAAGVKAIATPAIAAGGTPGYNTASLPIFNDSGETKLNFWQQTGGDWNLVNLTWYNDPHENASIEPNCESFESLEGTRQAFSGQACFNTSLRTQSTIH